MLSLSQLTKGQLPVPTYSSIEHEDLNVVPIDPSWILGGEPVSRVKRIHVAPDERYEVSLWECTPGSFRWYFGCDEVVHIIQGEVHIREDDGTERTLRVGDVAMFPRGATNIWTVTKHVRKVAINRWHPPSPVDLVRKAVRFGRARVKKLLRAS